MKIEDLHGCVLAGLCYTCTLCVYVPHSLMRAALPSAAAAGHYQLRVIFSCGSLSAEAGFPAKCAGAWPCYLPLPATFLCLLLCWAAKVGSLRHIVRCVWCHRNIAAATYAARLPFGGRVRLFACHTCSSAVWRSHGSYHSPWCCVLLYRATPVWLVLWHCS